MKNKILIVCIVGFIFGCLFGILKPEVYDNIMNEPEKSIVKIEVNIPHLEQNNMKKYMFKTNYKMYPELSDIIYKSIIKYSNEFDVDPLIIFSVINQESRFSPWKVSHADCSGLMQINYKVWKNELNKNNIINCQTELFDPEKNIRAGTFILRHYLDQAYKKNKTLPYNYTLKRYFGGNIEKYAISVMSKKESYLKWLEKI